MERRHRLLLQVSDPRQPLLLLLATIGPLMGTALPEASATAAASGTFGAPFNASAAGNGVRVTGDISNTVAENPLDFGGPTAQSQVDSLGTSRAFASHPYPGDIPLQAPSVGYGILLGAVPQLSQVPPPPAYPFYVASSFPDTPEAEATGPGQALEAESRSTSSSSRASSGFDAPGVSGAFARSASSVTSGPDGVEATGQSRIASFVLGPVAIGEVVSTATARLTPDGTLERTAGIAVTGLTVAGVPVEITSGGVTTPAGNSTLPTTSAVDGALEQAGISLGITPQENTSHGVVAPALKIVQRLPNDGGTMTYLLGSATSSVEGGAAEALPVDDVGDCIGDCSTEPPPERVEDTSSAPAESPPPIERAAAATVPATALGEEAQDVEIHTDPISGSEPAGSGPLLASPPKRGSFGQAAFTRGQALFSVTSLSLLLMVTGIAGLLGLVITGATGRRRGGAVERGSAR